MAGVRKRERARVLTGSEVRHGRCATGPDAARRRSRPAHTLPLIALRAVGRRQLEHGQAHSPTPVCAALSPLHQSCGAAQMTLARSECPSELQAESARRNPQKHHARRGRHGYLPARERRAQLRRHVLLQARTFSCRSIRQLTRLWPSPQPLCPHAAAADAVSSLLVYCDAEARPGCGRNVAASVGGMCSPRGRTRLRSAWLALDRRLPPSRRAAPAGQRVGSMCRLLGVYLGRGRPRA